MAIANGEYEANLATFREAARAVPGAALVADVALRIVEQHLRRRTGDFASGGSEAMFILRELEEAVADLMGDQMPVPHSQPRKWQEYLR